MIDTILFRVCVYDISIGIGYGYQYIGHTSRTFYTELYDGGERII